MSFYFRANNIPRLQNTLQNLPDSALNAIGSYLVGQAKLRCPVDTGRLKGSIQATVSRSGKGASLSIGSNVNYAIFVHEGTRRKAARRFITDAVNENMAQITAMATALLRRF